MMASDPLRFGGFVLNRERGCLEDATGAERILRPKSYRVLEVLCERRRRLVSKDELIEQVWTDVIASDDSLAQCVSEIRRALGPEGAMLVHTVPRRGYLLSSEESVAGAANSGKLTPTPVARFGMCAAAVVMAMALTGAWWSMPGNTPILAPEQANTALVQAGALLESRDWRRREDNERARALLETVVAELARQCRRLGAARVDLLAGGPAPRLGRRSARNDAGARDGGACRRTW